jgi:hypothetical protein
LHPVSPPTFYLVFQPLRRLSFERAFLACHVLGLLGVALAVVAVGAALRASTGAILLWIAIAAALFAPVLADAYVGNITRLQIGLLGAFVWCLAGESPRRNLAGGAILGLDLLVKPSTPSIVMFGLMLVLSDRWRRPWGRALATAAATVAAGIALTSLCFGSPRSWLLWRQAAEQLRDAPPTLAAANYSLLAWIDEVAGGWAGCAFALAVLAAAAQGLWRRAQAAEPGPAGAGAVAALLVGLGGLATTLTERLVWPQYFTLAIPALLYVFRPAPVQTAGAARAWAVHAAAALPVVLFVLPRLVRGSTHTAGFLLFNGGAALLLGCLLFGDQRRGPSAHDGRTAQ